MTKPTEYPLWATNLVNEVKTVEGNTVTLPNRITVPTEYSDGGILFGTTVIQEYINQTLHLNSLWVQHLDTRIAVGHIHLDYAPVAVSVLATRYGGTWQAEGSQTLGTITAYVYRKLT